MVVFFLGVQHCLELYKCWYLLSVPEYFLSIANIMKDTTSNLCLCKKMRKMKLFLVICLFFTVSIAHGTMFLLILYLLLCSRNPTIAINSFNIRLLQFESSIVIPKKIIYKRLNN